MILWPVVHCVAASDSSSGLVVVDPQDCGVVTVAFVICMDAGILCEQGRHRRAQVLPC